MITKYITRCFLVIFVILGIEESISIIFELILYNRARRPVDGNSNDGDIITGQIPGFSHEAVPIKCHSHNDYWRQFPLFSAIKTGCISVEADVWLSEEELYVGHSASFLDRQRTLRSVYIDPLVKILTHMNHNETLGANVGNGALRGVFSTTGSQSLVLLIDIKSDGNMTWPVLVKEIAILRDRGYLTYFNGEHIIPGPITVVGTGNTPFHLVTANSSYRDIFFDAPLDELVNVEVVPELGPMSSKYSDSVQEQGYPGGIVTDTSLAFNRTNSVYASVSFKKIVGFPAPLYFTKKQLSIIRSQIRAAHSRGLMVRYWALPDWPLGLRSYVWRMLAREGVDVLNVDDLRSIEQGSWM